MVVTDWESLKKAWNPGTKRCTGRLYIGDTVKVSRGRKVPIGIIGVITKLWENKFDPISYDDLKATLTLQAVGYEIEAVQWTNANVVVTLENGSTVKTYLKNLDLVKVKEVTV